MVWLLGLAAPVAGLGTDLGVGMSRPKCAKCAGPSKLTLYRKELPVGVPKARCKPHGSVWAIPCCPMHHMTLSRCSSPGCTEAGNKGGRCWRHYQRKAPPLPVCIRCKGELNLAYCRGSRALCRACTDAVAREGSSAQWAKVASAIREGKSGTLRRLVRVHGLDVVCQRVQRGRTDVVAFADGLRPVPAPVWAQCLDMLRGE